MTAIEVSVRDAVAANVDDMAGPARIIERAIASAAQVRSRRRRVRMLVAGAAAATAGAVGIVLASARR